MGNSLAFPVPQSPSDYYERVFRVRQDIVHMTTSEGERIPACYCRNRSGDAQQPRITLLYSHGNAEDLADAVEHGYVDALAQATGTDVFAYEYVGYSLSSLEGAQPSEAGCLRSIDAAWRYCVEDLKIPAQRIVIFGRSIGSGPTVDLASRTVEGCAISPLDAAGVLLQSPIESGGRAVLGYVASIVAYPLDIFRNYEKIGKITAPVAIMHGTTDRVVPVGNGQNLHEMLQRPFEPLWIENHGHNDMPQERCFRYAKRFVDSLRP